MNGKHLHYISKNVYILGCKKNHHKISKIQNKINFYMCNKEVNISYSFFEILKHLSKPLFSQKKKIIYYSLIHSQAKKKKINDTILNQSL